MEFNRIIEYLKTEKGLQADAKIKHRLWLRDEIYADFIPFGGIEDEKGEYAWAPDFEDTLNVQGFQLAYQDAVEIQIGNAVLKVIRPCWLAMLKLKSFSEASSRTKDLIDVFFIVDHYLEFIDEESKLYGPNATDADIFDLEPFDTRVAGATLIVRDCHFYGGNILGKIQTDIQKFNSNDALTIVFARINSLQQKEAQELLNILLKPLS